MAGLCKAVLIGYAETDPDIRYAQDGTAVTDFYLAVTQKVRDADKTLRFRVTAFGKLAEICQQYLSEGMQIYADGRLAVRNESDRDGNTHLIFEVTADTIQMLGSRAKTGES